MNNAIFYILVMAAVTYLIRVLPLILSKNEIKNTFIRSFLYYVPYVTLAVIVFPSILESTASITSALVGFIVAIIFSIRGASIISVALLACLSVYIVELFLY